MKIILTKQEKERVDEIYLKDYRPLPQLHFMEVVLQVMRSSEVTVETER